MSNLHTLEVINRQLDQQPQRQDSLAAQLYDLRVAANRLGLYDAADFIAKVLENELDGLTHG